MSDSHENGSAAESAGRKRREFSGVGVVFAIVGVVFLLTMDNFAIGIPFIVLGAVFFGMGFRTWPGRPGRPGQGAANPGGGPEEPRS